MRRSLLLVILAASVPAITLSQAKETHGPDCSGSWPTNMTFAHLKNAGFAFITNDPIFTRIPDFETLVLDQLL
jgi:hypothetical protein